MLFFFCSKLNKNVFSFKFAFVVQLKGWLFKKYILYGLMFSFKKQFLIFFFKLFFFFFLSKFFISNLVWYLQLSISIWHNCLSIGKYWRFIGHEAVIVSLKIELNIFNIKIDTYRLAMDKRPGIRNDTDNMYVIR
jgi:hypothetical protein